LSYLSLKKDFQQYQTVNIKSYRILQPHEVQGKHLKCSVAYKSLHIVQDSHMLYYIYISDTFEEQHPNSGDLCFHDQQNGYANTLQNITCYYPGRYVVIYNQRNSSNAFLELCEVEVYGKI
jgi:hypothetical protein